MFPRFIKTLTQVFFQDYYISSRIATMMHRCHARLYGRNSIMQLSKSQTKFILPL
jgi:hypothetical protein